MFTRPRRPRNARFVPSIDVLGGRITPSGGIVGTVELPPNDPNEVYPILVDVQAEAYRMATVEFELSVTE